VVGVTTGATAIVRRLDAALEIDPAVVAQHLESAIRDQVFHALHRRGAVVGLSGGVDSSVVAALAARALGPGRVVGLIMPERESSPASESLARSVAERYGIMSVVEEITGALTAMQCYQRRDAAIRRVVPEYADGYRCKIVLPDVITRPGYALYFVVVRAPSGEERRVRLTLDAYLEVVAATNFKQRVRSMLLYHHADRLRYAVAGTPNRLEYELGFYVKQGDGAADLKPIARLYKSQVYALAEYLGVPEAVRSRPPTTDTYSLEQSQEEFYFGLSLRQTDVLLHAKDHDVPAAELAEALGLTVEQATRAFAFVDAQRRAARYLAMPPLVTEVEETL
jgi:NAD+ synthase